MENYVEVIKIAIITFPFIALTISLPFLLSQYHKYGSVSMFKALIIYSFVLYLTCAYFLVILPLPTFAEVAAMNTPRAQLVPFAFVGDFITHSALDVMNPATYVPTLMQSYFFVPIYNILLTLPFGIYLHYYFRRNLKQVVVITFLLSLFFELTQLTGLYFIYPRGYRLFDVDDLILNTLGGVVGYFLAIPLTKVLPDRAKLDAYTLEKGQVVSGMRRTLAFWLDLIACMFLYEIIKNLLFVDIEDEIIKWGWILFYYLVIPIFLHGSTLIEKFLKLRVVDLADRLDYKKIALRRVIFLAIYAGIPFLGFAALKYLVASVVWQSLLMAVGAGMILVFYIATSLKFLFTTKPMLYEKLSQTKLISTTPIPQLLEE